MTVHVTGVTIDNKVSSLMENSKYETEITVLPSDSHNKHVIWATSDENVAIVENGVVKTRMYGTAVITVTTEDGGKTDSFALSVNPLRGNLASRMNCFHSPPRNADTRKQV